MQERPRLARIVVPILVVLITTPDADGFWDRPVACHRPCRPLVECRTVPVERRAVPPPEPARPETSFRWPRGQLRRAELLCEHAIRACDELQPYSNYADLGTYLSPIRVRAFRALASARAGSDGDRLADQMAELYRVMVAADPYIDDMVERDAARLAVLEFLIGREGLAMDGGVGR